MSESDRNTFRKVGAVTVMDDAGETKDVMIASDVVEAAVALVDDPGRYFLEASGSFMVPIEQLVQTRARPEGIGNAVKLMQAAYDGNLQRRAPISVSALADERYVVNDGNSTVAVAKVAGWKSVPCLLGKRANPNLA